MRSGSPYGPSLLMKAVMDGSANTVKFLVEAGADPNIFDEASICHVFVSSYNLLSLMFHCLALCKPYG